MGWETILRKRDGFRHPYDDFDVDRVPDYGDGDRARLLSDAGIIRNRLKVVAANQTAGVIRGLRESHGGRAEWPASHAVADGRPRDNVAVWKLVKRPLRVHGGET